MANDYINPFSAVDPAAFGEGKTPLETFFGYQKNLQAQPFIDMARQQGQMDLQTNQQKQTEFMSGPAQAARMSAFGADSAKNKQIMDVSPHETLYKIKKAQDDLRASPFLTDELIAKANKYVQDFKHEPFNEFKAGLGGLGERLDQLPANMPKGMKDALGKSLYGKFVTDWQMKYPNEKLPEHLKYYDQDTPHQIKIAQYTNTLIAERAAKERLKEMELKSEEKRTGMTAGATITAGAAHDAASERNAQLVAGTKEQQLHQRVSERVSKTVGELLRADINYSTADEKTKAEKRAAAMKFAIELDDELQRRTSATPPTYAPGAAVPPGYIEMISPDGRKARVLRSAKDKYLNQGFKESK